MIRNTLTNTVFVLSEKKKNKAYVLQRLSRWRHCLSVGMLEIVTARQQLKLQRSPVLTNVKTWSHQKGQNMKRKTKVFERAMKTGYIMELDYEHF